MDADDVLELLASEETQEAAEAAGDPDLWSSIAGTLDSVSAGLEFLKEHWLALALTGEIVGAVLAFKFRHYYRGAVWLLAALATVWAGAFR